MSALLRTRWAAIGAAVAVALGAGGFGLANAALSSGERSTFVPITPCRILDTRTGSAVVTRQTPLGAGETYTQNAHGSNGLCSGIPGDATALSLNVTAINATVAGTYLTIWPTGAAQPDASSLNPVPGQPPTPNAVITDISTGGQFSIFNYSGTVDLLVDVNGYYADHDHDDRYYTKPQLDTSLGTKANSGEVYTTAQIDQRAPRTGYVSVSSVAFRPTASDVTYVRPQTSGVYVTGGAAQRLVAPVYLPDSATVTDVTVYYWDDATKTLEVSLHCENTGPPWSEPTLRFFRSSGASASWQVAAMPGSSFKVNNTACLYSLEVDAIFNDDWAPAGSSLQLKGVVITYEMPA